MRPDKKKTVHHDSVKSKNKAIAKAAEKAKKDENTQKKKPSEPSNVSFSAGFFLEDTFWIKLKTYIENRVKTKIVTGYDKFPKQRALKKLSNDT